jgi:hypothetical protein
MKTILHIVLVLGSAALCSTCLACGCAVSGGGGSTRGGGGIVDVSAHRGGCTQSSTESDTINKAPLPPAVEVSSLTTAMYDRAASQLALSKEQEEQVQKVVNQLRDAALKMADLQATTRATYARATTKTDVFNAARHVTEAADAIKSFDPNAMFEAALAKILTAEQREKYRKLKGEKT